MKDRVVLLDALNAAGGSAALTYDRRRKDEPARWLVDAVCGAVADFLLRSPGRQHYFAQLQAAAVLEALIYLAARES